MTKQQAGAPGRGIRHVLRRSRSAAGAAAADEGDTRHRHALDIHDHIVQGLTVASYALDLGEQAMARAALERTLIAARILVSDLLDGATATGADLLALRTGH
jgi:hypothetical protein